MTGLSVDVVVITLDRAEDTHECIDSILAQDHPDFRLWVLDQGSGKDMVSSLKQRAARDGFVFVEGEQTGVPAGRNQGYGLGEAPVIVALDNDAVLADTGVLSRVAKSFQKNPKLGALAFAVHDYFGGGPDVGSWGYPWPVESHFQKDFRTARFCGAGHAVSRMAWEAAGGYDEQLFFFAEELDLSWSMIARGYEVRYTPEIAVRHKSAQERRIQWDDGRFYYNVRNMVYLIRKHLRDRPKLLAYCLGYLYRGARNGMPGTAYKGIRDGLGMVPEKAASNSIDDAAREYIEKYEFAPRGSALQRFLQEVQPRLLRSRR